MFVDGPEAGKGFNDNQGQWHASIWNSINTFIEGLIRALMGVRISSTLDNKGLIYHLLASIQTADERYHILIASD